MIAFTSLAQLQLIWTSINESSVYLRANFSICPSSPLPHSQMRSLYLQFNFFCYFELRAVIIMHAIDMLNHRFSRTLPSLNLLLIPITIGSF